MLEFSGIIALSVYFEWNKWGAPAKIEINRRHFIGNFKITSFIGEFSCLRLKDKKRYICNIRILRVLNQVPQCVRKTRFSKAKLACHKVDLEPHKTHLPGPSDMAND